MDLMEWGDISSGCEDENCGLVPSFQDCSNEDCHWEEPENFGLIELVCVTVIYIPLMLFGLLGNILTILVVWLRPHMRSSTYLYLSSMAVSDLLILLLLPLDLYKLWRPRPWPLGDLACKLTVFLSECCTFCTILHITFLSLERYLAVCWPITAKTLVTRSRTRALIGCLWLGAVVSAAPVLVMVGVEDFGGGGERGLERIREDGGWTGWEGEQGGFMIAEGERDRGHVVSVDGGFEEMKWEEKDKRVLGERVGEFKWLEEKGEREVGIQEKDKRKQGAERKNKLEKQEGGSEGKVEIEGEQQNKKREDEGGGQEVGSDGGETDIRECRCTQYAASSGLLSAMMILSNLYFLVPLCILGLVYSLIGRTLWLRPQSSRRDQSHRHTVKMLGVIVLAFVLCWLPFHVGRTIFFFSFDKQETHTDSNLDINALSDISIHTVTEPINFSSCRNTQTHKNMQENRSITCIHSQNHTSTIKGPNTYAETPTSLNSDNTHSETHLLFLYYLSQYFNLVSSVLFYLSAAINPLLYNLMSARYRHAVLSLIHTHSHTPSHRLHTLTTRHSTTTL